MILRFEKLFFMVKLLIKREQQKVNKMRVPFLRQLCHKSTREISASWDKTLNSWSSVQKQPPEMLYGKRVLRNFPKFTGKHLCQSLFFNKVAGLRHRCSTVNFAKFLRTPFFQNTSGRLLLSISTFSSKFVSEGFIT